MVLLTRVSTRFASVTRLGLGNTLVCKHKKAKVFWPTRSELTCTLFCLHHRNIHTQLSGLSMSTPTEQPKQEQEADRPAVDDKLEQGGEMDPGLMKRIVLRPKVRDTACAMEKLDLNADEKTNNDKPDGGESRGESVANKKQEQPKGVKAARGGAKEPPAPEKPIDISRLDLRIGKILEVDKHPDADSLYVEKIDCGDETGPRTVISGLVKHVPIDEMCNRNVVVLCNLKPVKMRGILSEAMVMCASTPDKVELLTPPDDVKPGDRVVFDNYVGEPDAQLNPKKKIWEQVAPDIKTNDEGVAMYKECPFKLANGLGGQFRSNLKNVPIR